MVMLRYWPNPAHKRETTQAGPPQWRPDKTPCPPMAVEERVALLGTSLAQDPASGSSPRFALRRGPAGLEFFEGRLTRWVGEDPEFHGFPTARVPAPVLRQFRDMGLVTAAEYRRLVKDLG